MSNIHTDRFPQALKLYALIALLLIDDFVGLDRVVLQIDEHEPSPRPPAPCVTRQRGIGQEQV